MVATSPSSKAADSRGLLPIIVKGAICLVLLSALLLSCLVVVRLVSGGRLLLSRFVHSFIVTGWWALNLLHADRRM